MSILLFIFESKSSGTTLRVYSFTSALDLILLTQPIIITCIGCGVALHHGDITEYLSWHTVTINRSTKQTARHTFTFACVTILGTVGFAGNVNSALIAMVYDKVKLVRLKPYPIIGKKCTTLSIPSS